MKPVRDFVPSSNGEQPGANGPSLLGDGPLHPAPYKYYDVYSQGTDYLCILRYAVLPGLMVLCSEKHS